MMNTFFKELRLMLARELGARIQPEDIAIGEVVMDKINSDFIPELEDKLSKEDDERKREELQNLISIWGEYGDRRNPLSKVWNEIAAHEIANVFWGVDDAVAEDAAQTIAMQAIQRNWLDRFDMNKGPERMRAFWRKVIFNQARNQQEIYFRKNPKDSLDEEGTPEPVQDYSELEKLINRETRIDLGRYVHQRAKQDVQRDMYDMWQDLALEQGASKVDKKHDIFPILMDRYGVKSTRLKQHWKKVRELIVEYFKEELGIVIPTRVEKRLFRGSEELSVADRIAVQRYRRLMAAWILGPLVEGTDA